MSTYRTVVIERLSDLAPHVDEWSRLAAITTNPNVYYSPEFLVPNLEHIEKRGIVLFFIYKRATTVGLGNLIGFAPFAVEGPRLKRPFAHLASLQNDYLFQFNPLIDPRHSDEAWRMLIGELQDPSHAWHLTDLLYESESTELPTGLVQHLKHSRTTSCRKPPGRACIRKPVRFDAFLQGLGSKTRRNYRRALRRLADLGPVEFRLNRQHESIGDLIDDFLTLEQAGWKGTTGSAIGNSDRDVRFLHEVARNFNSLGRLFHVELRLDGRLIGASLAHTQGATLFAFKLAYDKDFARYSPGSLAMFETIRRFLDDPHLTSAHAGANVHSWVSRYYRDEADVYNFSVPTRRPLGLVMGWGLNTVNRIRGVDVGQELVAVSQVESPSAVDGAWAG